MLVSMSEIDPRADAPLVDWSDLGVSGLLPIWRNVWGCAGRVGSGT
jgi:hypothetical protein